MYVLYAAFLFWPSIYLDIFCINGPGFDNKLNASMHHFLESFFFFLIYLLSVCMEKNT